MLRHELATEIAFAREYPDPVPRSAPVVIYGAGKGGRQFLDHLRRQAPDMHVAMFIDDDPAKQAAGIDGIPVAGVEQAATLHTAAVVIALADWHGAASRLRERGITQFFSSHDFLSHIALPTGSGPAPMGFSHFSPAIYGEAWERLDALDQLLADQHSRAALRSILRYRLTRQPFELLVAPFHDYQHPKVQAVPDDIVLDCGGFDGDTALLFARTMENRGHIHVFEPSPVNCARLSDAISTHGLTHFVETHALAVSDVPGTLHFEDVATSPVSSHLSARGAVAVEVVALDEFCTRRDIRPTLVKMDIEGSEPAALRGAATLIRERRPKLQICVYHAPEHLWEIPLYLHQLVPGYQFYLAQHAARHWSDTILYAV